MILSKLKITEKIMTMTPEKGENLCMSVNTYVCIIHTHTLIGMYICVFITQI